MKTLNLDSFSPFTLAHTATVLGGRNPIGEKRSTAKGNNRSGNSLNIEETPEIIVDPAPIIEPLPIVEICYEECGTDFLYY